MSVGNLKKKHPVGGVLPGCEFQFSFPSDNFGGRLNPRRNREIPNETKKGSHEASGNGAWVQIQLGRRFWALAFVYQGSILGTYF